jgi:hypothetical protein
MNQNYIVKRTDAGKIEQPAENRRQFSFRNDYTGVKEISSAFPGNIDNDESDHQ